MSIYFNDTEAVLQGRIGRKLEAADNYEAYTAQLVFGEQLYLAAFMGRWWIIVHIESQQEYDSALTDCYHATNLQFYALPINP